MRIRLSWFFLLAVVAVFLTTTSAWEVRCDAVAESLFVAGIVLAGVGAMGRIWCSVYIAGYKNGPLIVNGPYSICRNPLYFFSLIGSLGVAMTTETTTIPLIVGLAFAIYYPSVIRREEVYLLGLHGDLFLKYMQAVPRFFPRIGLLIETEAAPVHLITFRKHMMSAIWFVWLPAFTGGVEVLHDLHWLPTYFSLY